MSNDIVKANAGPSAGEIERKSFGGAELERRGETASSAIVAQARAEIEARYVMALQRPRDFADVRIKLLAACKRPAFARGALYRKPQRGAKGRISGMDGVVEGLSIRFAEEAFRAAGNLYHSVHVTYDDDYKRIAIVRVVDLESNTTGEASIVVEKTVERREAKDGTVILGRRTNSAGIEVYIVQATEQEILAKVNGLASRALRTEGLRLIPSDILEECEQAAALTARDEDAKDPEAARKRLLDSFATIGVMPSDLALYIGNELAAASPAQLEDLRGLFAAVRDGEVTFADALKAVTSLRDVEAKGTPVADDKGATQAKRVVDKIRERGKKASAKKGEAKKEDAPAATTAEEPTKPHTPAAKGSTAPPPADGRPTPPADAKCVTCSNPLPKTGAVETTTPDGEVAWRHAECKEPRMP